MNRNCRALLPFAFAAVITAGCSGAGAPPAGPPAAAPLMDAQPPAFSPLAKAPKGTLFAAAGISGGTVTAFKPPYKNHAFAVMQGFTAPFDAALDTKSDLFVADPYAMMTLWFYPYRKHKTFIGNSGFGAVLVDSKNVVFAADTGGSGGVYEIAPPYKKVTREIDDQFTNYPSALAMDAHHVLFIVNQLGGNVAYYPSPYSRASGAVTGIAPAASAQAIAIDSKDRLFAIDGGSQVDIYPKPYGKNGSITIETGIDSAAAIFIDKKDQLFVANQAYTASGYGSVAIYKPPYSKPFAVIHGKGISDPESLTTDEQGDLFVGNLHGGAAGGFVSMFKPPYTKGYTSLTSGIS
ncbi:MAG TPA: hypothetical protein VMF61_12345, partial [Candidatus Acidoferrales bacterium]|nr:hypothetical protein [Candidatus Acidoferrales bacterium]